MNDNVTVITRTLDKNLASGAAGTTVEVPKVELAYALAYISELERKLEAIREKNRFLIGDPVRLDPDPDHPESCPEGVIVGFGSGNTAIVSSGEFESLWFTFDELERIER